MKVNLQSSSRNYNYPNKQSFSSLIIKDAKYWNPQSLDRFVKNKEIQKLTTILHNQDKNAVVAKARITGTLNNRIYIHLEDGLKKIAHIKEDELHMFSAEKALNKLYL